MKSKKTQKGKLRRIVSMVLVLCLILTMGILPAQAESDESPGSTRKITAETQKYTDVPTTAWFYHSVKEIDSYGIMNGYGDGTFGPNNNLTREQFVKVLAMTADIDVSAYQSTDIHRVFSDVPNQKWYSPYVAWAYDNKITNGISSSEFGIGQSVTREQVARFLNLFTETCQYRLNTVESPVDFSDMDKVSSWALADVEKVRSTGLFQGDAEKRYNPGSGITRAEAATVVIRLIGQMEENSGKDYFLQALTADKSRGTVSVTGCADGNARIQLEIYSEDQTRLIGKQTIGFRTIGEVNTVEMNVGKTVLPDYFVLKAVLLDRKGNPLTEPLVSMRYTRKYQQFENKTVNSFDSDRVMNLDDQADDNFAVVAKGTKLLTDGENVQILSVSKDETTYTLSGISKDSLHAGDRIVLEKDGGTCFLTVQSVSQNNGSLTVTTSSEGEMKDYLEYLRINMDVQGSPEKSALSSQPSAVPRGDITSDWGELSGSINVGFASAEGTFSASDTLHISVDYDFVLFGPDYLYMELWDDLSYTAEASLTMKTDKKGGDAIDLITFTQIGFDNLPKPIADILMLNFKVSVPLQFEVEGGFVLTTSGTMRIGWILDSENGSQSIRKNSATATQEIQAEGFVSLGPRAILEAKLGDLVNGYADFFAGVILTAELDKTAGQTVSSAPSYHACDICLEGDLTAAATATIHVDTWNGFGEVEANGEAISEPLFEFYVSLKNDPQSVHKGAITIGKGTCPNYLYRTTYETRETGGKVVSTVPVTAPDHKGTKTVYGGQYTYLYPGSYTASAVFKNETVSQPFSITSYAKKITLESKMAQLEIGAYDENHQPVQGLSVQLSGVGPIEGKGSTVHDGITYYTYLVPVNNTFDVTLSAEGYETVSRKIIVTSDTRSTYLMKKNQWLSAYIQFLSKQSSGVRFALAYINNDDIPELVISYGAFHIATGEAYTYYNGAVTEVGGVSDYGNFTYAPKTGYIRGDSWANGYGQFITFYLMNKGEAEKQTTFDTHYQTNTTTVYHIDGKTVSKSTFDSRLNSWVEAYTWKSIGYGDMFDNKSATLQKLKENYKNFIL